jgi:hypothetical protein
MKCSTIYWPQNSSVVDVQCDSDKLNIHSGHYPGTCKVLGGLLSLGSVAEDNGHLIPA